MNGEMVMNGEVRRSRFKHRIYSLTLIILMVINILHNR